MSPIGTANMSEFSGMLMSESVTVQGNTGSFGMNGTDEVRVVAEKVAVLHDVVTGACGDVTCG